MIHRWREIHTSRTALSLVVLGQVLTVYWGPRKAEPQRGEWYRWRGMWRRDGAVVQVMDREPVVLVPALEVSVNLSWARLIRAGR